MRSRGIEDLTDRGIKEMKREGWNADFHGCNGSSRMRTVAA